MAFICSMIYVFIVFIAAAAVQIVYYALVFSRLAYGREHRFDPDEYPPVSVVICAKNEAENLRRNLKIIFIQNYPTYEVIVVNDQSTDDTINVVSDFFSRNTNLRLFNIKPGEKPLPGKKFALKTGIENAKYENIVVTDADCQPASAHWLEHLMSSYLSDTDFVLGYSPFYRHPGMVNKIARYENIMTAMQYMSYARVGIPYMGVGRNMSFRKSLFTGWSGSNRDKDLPGGDDDLFVNALARGRNTVLSLHKDSFTYSEAKSTWSDWLHQKRRHVSTGSRYRFHHQLLLFFFALSDFLFYTSFIVLCIKTFMLPIILLSLVLVLTIKYIVTDKINIKLQQADLSSWFLLLDPLYVLYLFAIFIVSIFSTKPEWK